MGLQKRKIRESFFGKKHKKIVHGRNFMRKIFLARKPHWKPHHVEPTLSQLCMSRTIQVNVSIIVSRIYHFLGIGPKQKRS